MVDFAQKLMTAAQIWSSDESLSIFNPLTKATRNPQKSIFRVGLWPIISSSEAEIGVGMGVGLVLAALLEQWPSVCVYRLMTKVDNAPADYHWNIEDSQFGVDDWEIEGLDENVAIWGSFALQDDRITLSLEVENDAYEDDSVLELNYESVTLAEMLNQLPAIAMKIMDWLNGTSTDSQNPYKLILSDDSDLAKNFLEDIFLWELDYFLELWGQGSSVDQVLNSQSNLTKISGDLSSDFGAWLISQSIARFILFDQANWNEWLLSTLKETVSALGKHPVAAVTLGSTLFRFGSNLEAFDVLETGLSLHPQDNGSWALLGELYGESGETFSAIDVYQRAIEADLATTDIYLRYAAVMDSLFEHQIELKEGTSRISAAGRPFIEQYIFTDSAANSPSLRESCVAYRHVLEEDVTNLDALSHLVTGLLSLHDPEVWDFCAQLIDNDREGMVIASIIEQLADSDMSQMLDILKVASSKKPQELSIHLNLARVYLAVNDNEKAKNELNAVSINDVPPQSQASVARLRLTADFVDFDARIGEIRDVLDAKGKVTSEDIEFLEAATVKEPFYSEGYRLLAQSYLSWNEPEHALEVLLDGQKTVPFDYELVALLANVLWDADEFDLAFACLDQGLKQNGTNATLLSLMGRFLFDDGEDESAKDYLRRAEAVDPLNSELAATRSYIANILIKFKKD